MVMPPKGIALYFRLDNRIDVADLAELLSGTFVRVL